MKRKRSNKVLTHMVRTYEFKIRPNAEFFGKSEDVLEHCRQIYNAALKERIDCYRITGKGLGLLEQSKHLTEARELPEVSTYLRKAQQDCLERLDKAFEAFFKRVKEGDTPGFPRFKGVNRYRTFSQKLNQYRTSPLSGDVLTVPGVGKCRLRLSRSIEGTIKQIRITKRADGWYALLVCEMVKPEPLPPTHKSVGIDVGIKAFATLSNGESVKNPHCFKKAQRKLAKMQRSQSRKATGSRNRKKANVKLAKANLKVARARKDFQHKLSTRLAKEFDSIAVEKLNIKGMVCNHRLSKAVLDAAWYQFFSLTRCKAENAGREFIERDPKYTSQTCSQCGHKQKLSLQVRVYKCANKKCGNVMCRDLNAAINIKVGLGKPKLKPVELGDTLTMKQERGWVSRNHCNVVSV